MWEGGGSRALSGPGITKKKLVLLRVIPTSVVSDDTIITTHDNDALLCPQVCAELVW